MNAQNVKKSFVRSIYLYRHRRAEHNYRGVTVILPGVNSEEEPFACHYCDKVYKDKNSVIRHIERKHTEETFDCDICSKRFSRRDTLQLHITQTHDTHKKQPKIICEICSQEFPGKQELKQHRLKDHENVSE